MFLSARLLRNGRAWCLRVNVISVSNATPELLSSLLCAPLPYPLLDSGYANVLDMILLQARKALSLSPRTTVAT
jgi:hypothetical protein